ncbi:MMPL family transporter [Streptomyces sp. NPDC085931]|uniref:MMPL family transporter n=1 Tax=Streptomyces sp. NPDC085931 TaxID=3365740 RepID=UPI0037CE5C70
MSDGLGPVGCARSLDPEAPAVERGIAFRAGLALARRRRSVIVAWLLLVSLSCLLLPRIVGGLASPFSLPGSRAEKAAHELHRSFPEFGQEQMLAVFHSRVGGPVHDQAVHKADSALRAQPGITGVLDLPLPDTVRGGGYTTAKLIGVDGSPAERLARAERQNQAAARAAHEASKGRVEAHLIGMSALSSQLQTRLLPTVRLAEALALLTAFLVLYLSFRRLAAALLPLSIAGGAVGICLTLLGFGPTGTLDLFSLVTTSALGLGLGIDYALLMLFRFREHRADGISGARSVAACMATSGKTIAYSALVVMTSAACLLLVDIPMVRSCALGAVAVTAVAAAAVLTLLPACLAAWPDAVCRSTRPSNETDGHQHSMNRGWERWARHLMRHPWRYVIVSMTALLLAAAPLSGLRTGFDLDRPSLDGTSFGTALRLLESNGVNGASAATFIVLPHADRSALAQVAQVMAEVDSDPAVAAAFPVTGQNGTTMIVVVPEAPVDAPRTSAMIERFRQLLPRALPQDQAVLVGGAPAAVSELREMVHDSVLPVGAGLLITAFLFLLVAFRSILLPVKAVLANLVVTAASCGLLAAASPLLGTGNDAVISECVPLITIVMLFALSLDYEMFLVCRMREHYLRTGSNTEAVVAGLTRTARPISLAAVLMVCTFSSLLVIDRAELRQFGFSAAVAITLDATLVRLVLMPALMQLLGRWNWWLPGLVPPRRGQLRLPAQFPPAETEPASRHHV